jgi:hypothetical protein
MLYRIQCAGHKLLYAPQLLVFHDHGRRIGDDDRPTFRRYMRGRGGFYAKYLRRGDRHILKCAYREVRRAAVAVVRGLLHGKFDREVLQELATMMSGAFAYMRASQRQQNEPSTIRIVPAPNETAPPRVTP